MKVWLVFLSEEGSAMPQIAHSGAGL